MQKIDGWAVTFGVARRDLGGPPSNDQCIPTSYYSMLHYNCLCALKELLETVPLCVRKFQVRKHVHADRAVMTSCQCRAACDELFYDVSYSMARWPAPGFEGDAVFHDIFNVNHFLEHFGDSETIRRHFNETGDRTKALQDFARINVYVADPEVDVLQNHSKHMRSIGRQNCRRPIGRL